MAKELCPVCGCTVTGNGVEKGGVKYCCEACSTQTGACACGCCTVEETKPAGQKHKK